MRRRANLEGFRLFLNTKTLKDRNRRRWMESMLTPKQMHFPSIMGKCFSRCQKDSCQSWVVLSMMDGSFLVAFPLFFYLDSRSMDRAFYDICPRRIDSHQSHLDYWLLFVFLCILFLDLYALILMDLYSRFPNKYKNISDTLKSTWLIIDGKCICFWG